MSIKSILTTTACAVALSLPTVAHAQFGGLMGGNKSGASANVGAEVEKFMVAATDSNTLTSNSLAQMLAAISSTQEATKLTAQAKDAASVADPKEKNAKLGAVATDLATELQKAMADKANQEKVSKLDADAKKKLAKSFFNYALGVLRAKDVIPQGQNVIKSVSANPMEVGKVAAVKDVLPQLQNVVSNSGNLLSSIPTFFKQANISAEMPKAANAKPEEGLG